MLKKITRTRDLYRIGSFINGRPIRNTHLMKYVKGFDKTPREFGFRVEYHLNDDSRFRKEIDRKLDNSDQKGGYQVAHINQIVFEYLKEEVYPVFKYEKRGYTASDHAVYDYTAPLSELSNLRKVIYKVDNFLDELPSLVAKKARELYAKEQLDRSVRNDYVVNHNIPSLFTKLMSKNGLLHYTNEIHSIKKDRIGFERLYREGIPSVGESKIGGLPDLPDMSYWPEEDGTKLGLLLQINLKQVSRYDKDNLLPKEGLLSFFYDSVEMPWESDGKGLKVLYIKDEKLSRMEATSNLDERNRYKELRIGFKNEDSFPLDTGFDFQNESDQDNYFVMCEGKEGFESYLFGYPVEVQNDVIDDNYHIFDNKGSNIEDWILLLQLDSEKSVNMMWGDMGKLYFLIKKEDLKNENFNNVRLLLQCF